MRWRYKIGIAGLVWASFLAADMWATIGRHTLLIFPIGCFGMIGAFSITMRVITGKWPDWPAVWRMFRHRD